MPEESEQEPPARRRRVIRWPEQEDRRKVQRQLTELVGKDGMWPLNAPGMPEPGPDFMRAATDLGDDTKFVRGTKTKECVYQPGERLRDLYRRALRERGFGMDVEIRKGLKREPVTFVPGHIWGPSRLDTVTSADELRRMPTLGSGPYPAEIMVVGKMPWHEETSAGRNLVGASGSILHAILNRLHVRGRAGWYITNLVKFTPPHNSTSLKAGWIKDCMPILHQELRVVRPKYILCLGADASKALLGEKFGVGYMEGRVVDLTYPIHPSSDDIPEMHKALVMTVLHPAEVARSPDKERVLERGLSRFSLLTSGARFDKEEQGLDHRLIDTLEDAEDLLHEIDLSMTGWSARDRLIAWDAEWQGQHPMNEGAYVRTIQISWGEKKAACFKIAHQGGKPAFRDRDGKPAVKRLVKLLNQFSVDKRAVGHFFVSDLEWLTYMGINPIASCHVPLEASGDTPAWERLRRGEGWLDTAMMAHAIEETAALGLESLAMRYTTCQRYDIPLEDWKKEYCSSNNITASGLEGYGDCPDKVLVPYANYDPDATLRIAKALLPLLDSDYEGNCCWEPCWESMIIQKVILRIHQNGILVDRSIIDDLTKKFITARASQEDKIRSWARWPDFNVRSVQQVKEFLFGEKLNGKITADGKPIQIRPPEARRLYLEPLLDTSKPPRRWQDLKERGLDNQASPGTGKMILGILAQENLNVSEQVGWVRDYRFLDQVLKSVLRVPKVDENDKWVENDNGELEYEAGLAASIDADGRVRTHMYPTAETGRWKSSRPNLQNISKSRDPDYERMLGRDKDGKLIYDHKLREVLIASEGYALIEFDYKGAELYGMALMAGSKLMQDHCLRSMHPDAGYDEKGNPSKGGKYPHPDYYDIHSNVAVLAFHLNCQPTKGGLKSIGKAHFRTLAKNVIFGIAYGRGAKAIALQAKEQGVNVTVEEAQQVIDTIFQLYKELVPFFQEAKDRALDEKWLCHCFGRLRRFPNSADYKMEGEFERQAMNFPIQGMIASAVDRGLAWLDHEIDQQNLQDDIRLLLQMHDAGLVEARYEMVPYAIELIKWAMVDQVPIYPSTLDGVPTGAGPYYLGLEFSVEKHWGAKFSREECERFGLSTEFAA